MRYAVGLTLWTPPLPRMPRVQARPCCWTLWTGWIMIWGRLGQKARSIHFLRPASSQMLACRPEPSMQAGFMASRRLLGASLS